MYGSNLFKRELNQTASRIAVAVTMSVATPLALPTVAWSQTVTAGQTCVTAVVAGVDSNGDPIWVGQSAGATVTDPGLADPANPATGRSNYSLACGGNAAAIGNESVAVGFGAGILPNNGSYDVNDGTNPATASSATRATAVGVKSYVHENNGSAFGYSATTSGDGGVAIGAGALAGDTTDLNNKLGAGAIAIGADSQAKYSGSIAIGKEAKVGTAAGSASTDTGGIAIGESAESWKKDAIAIGSNSSAQHENSIAIGAGVVTTADNQISIGKTGQTYRLGGLATPNDGKTYVVKVDQTGDLSTVEMAAGASEPGLKLSGATANSAASAASVGAFTNASAIGSGAQAKADNATAVGAGSTANFAGAVAVGQGSEVTGADGLAFGRGSIAGAGGIALGQGSQVTGADGLAFGRGSNAGAGGIAIGQGVTAAANQTVIGGSTYQLSGLKANTGSASTSGYVVTVDTNGNLGWAAAGGGGGASEPGLKLSGATANSAANPASVGAFTNAVALGSGAQVTGAGGIAIGAGVSAGAGETVIGGTKYRLTGLGAPSSGGQYFVTVDSSGNLGFSTVSGGGGGDPLGWKASGTNGGAATASTITPTKADALALGSGASVTENNGVALGAKSVAGALDALALGTGSSATGTNSVALGAKSTAGSANSGMSLTIAGQTLTNYQAANGVVSVSGNGINRQITGVADGAVGDKSTDAINGSQLFKVADALDDKMRNIGDTLGSGILGTTVSMTADGTLSTSKFTVGTAEYKTVQDAFAGINTSITNISNGGSVGVSLRGADGSTSLAPAQTSGKLASAIGSGATATGDNTLALGGGSKATAAGATAVGATAEATHAGSAAIGAGAKSERENQMVYGTASSTHTMKGTTSAESQAQVSKSDNYIMVTNTNGDVAAYRASDLNLASQSDLTNIRNEVNSVRHDVNRAFKQIDENTQGIAIAIAMTGALTLPVNHNFGISANWGNYEGKNAFSSTAAFRLSEHLIASGALGVGLDTGSVGTRVGVQMTW